MSAKHSQVTSIDDLQEDEVQPRKKTQPVSKANFNLPGASGQKKMVTIHQGEGAEGRVPVFLSLEGNSFHVPRNVKVALPVEIVDVLNNANNIVYEKEGDAMVPYEVHRFPFSEHAS